MKPLRFFLFFLILFFLIIGPALAQLHPFETTEESRQRHSAENYQIYEDHHQQAPLGGYSSPFGDPAPMGTERPGFTSPAPSPYSSPSPYDQHPRRPRY